MKEFFAILGVLAAIIVVANWNKIFTKKENGKEEKSKEVICEYANRMGRIVSIKGKSDDPTFMKMCESYKDQSTAVTIPAYTGIWYPYRYYYGNPYVYYYYPYYYMATRRHHRR